MTEKPIKPVSQIDVPDAIQWLNTCAAQAMGNDPAIDRFPVAAVYGEPKVLVAENASGRRFLLSQINPDAIRRIRTPGRWRWLFSRPIRLRSKAHPLVPLSRQVEIY